jgi:hypothetical protein
VKLSCAQGRQPAGHGADRTGGVGRYPGQADQVHHQQQGAAGRAQRRGDQERRQQAPHHPGRGGQFRQPGPDLEGQHAEQEPRHGAGDAEVVGPLREGHAVAREPGQQGQRADRQGDGDQAPLAGDPEQQRQGDIEPHLGADRPTDEVVGLGLADAPGVDEQHIGDDAGGVVARRVPLVDQPGRAGRGDGDEGQQGQPVQRPQPRHPLLQEVTVLGGAGQPAGIDRRHHIAGDHEEQVDDQAEALDRVVGQLPAAVQIDEAVEVEHHDHQSPDDAQGVQMQHVLGIGLQRRQLDHPSGVD